MPGLKAFSPRVRSLPAPSQPLQLVDTNSITIDPEKLLELQAGQTISPTGSNENLDFPINPERVAPVLRGV
jgi:hypothetical protein